jgi:hypothetical protein
MSCLHLTPDDLKFQQVISPVPQATPNAEGSRPLSAVVMKGRVRAQG